MISADSRVLSCDQLLPEKRSTLPVLYFKQYGQSALAQLPRPSATSEAQPLAQGCPLASGPERRALAAWMPKRACVPCYLLPKTNFLRRSGDNPASNPGLLARKARCVPLDHNLQP
eukprot:scaffold23009_cov56-Phaeocystis_antarctica.AAC.2